MKYIIEIKSQGHKNNDGLYGLHDNAEYRRWTDIGVVFDDKEAARTKCGFYFELMKKKGFIKPEVRMKEQPKVLFHCEDL